MRILQRPDGARSVARYPDGGQQLRGRQSGSARRQARRESCAVRRWDVRARPGCARDGPAHGGGAAGAGLRLGADRRTQGTGRHQLSGPWPCRKKSPKHPS